LKVAMLDSKTVYLKAAQTVDYWAAMMVDYSAA
jgi:hypothetical protein